MAYKFECYSHVHRRIEFSYEIDSKYKDKKLEFNERFPNQKVIEFENKIMEVYKEH